MRRDQQAPPPAVLSPNRLSQVISSDDLRTVPAFDGIEEDALEWLSAHVEERRLAPGERLFERGDEADRMFILLEGVLTIATERENGGGGLFRPEAGEITGLLPFSRMERWGGTGTAETDTRVAVLHRHHFSELVGRYPELTSRLVALMSDRVRDFARVNQQREKLMALGRLSAGLAHELNNPAAAVARTATDLRRRIEALPELVLRMAEAGLSVESVTAARALARHAVQNPSRDSLSAVARAEREEEVADWLERHGVPDGYALAETFVEVGLSADDLERDAADAGPEALAWIEGGLAARAMLGEIESAAGRISDLVTSVKSYSHMDQAVDRRPEELREGLESTLTMLGHKIRERGVRIERHYGDVPSVPVYGGELNQVWTNLLDNALDAVGEGGTVTISTSMSGPYARVEIEDDGPGVPPENQSRIFEPFFTTKGVGEGSGLGLDFVRRIVEQRHGGQVACESRPGRTVFTICLPTE